MSRLAMSIGHVGNYEVLERIGEGGMGVVFKARDVRLLRHVALKILPERFQLEHSQCVHLLQEARTLAAVSHPHIAICYDCAEGRLEPLDLVAPGTAGPHPETVLYLAMEYVPGRDLRSLIAGGALPIREAVRIAEQVASGLDAAHRAGVIHRDLTPANIRVTPEGDVKLLDFGLARSRGTTETTSSDSSTGSRAIAGTARYMSPEQAAGRHLDARTDLFSMGVICYEMITRHAPFEGETSLEVLYAIVNEDPHPLARFAAHVPPELERIVRKLLEKLPDDRYQSAHEVLTDLHRLAEALPHSTRGRASHAAWRPRRTPAGWRGLLPWGTAGVAAALALGVWPLLAYRYADARRVAVVDFQNRTGDPELDYACAGLGIDLLDALVQGTDLTVARPETRAGAGNAAVDPRAVARELGVGRVITGQLETAPEGARLRVRIFEGHRGAERARREFKSGFPLTYPLREAIAAEVAAALGARVKPSARGPARLGSAAYEDYLRGLELLADPDEPLGRDRALAAFDRAIAADSGFALGWAGRARSLWALYDHDHDVGQLRRAGEAAAIAVRLGPDLVQTHLAMARIDRENGHNREAVEELRRVLAVNPNNDDAELQLGAALRRAGDLPGAEECYRRAAELRPGSWRNWSALAGFLLGARAEPVAARSAYERVVALRPESNRGYEGVGNTWVLEGRYGDAIASYRRLPRPVTDPSLASNIATAYFFTRQMDAALHYYLLSVSLEPDDPVKRMNLGDCYTRMNRTTDARTQYLDAARLQRPALGVDPDSPRLALVMAVSFAKAGECDSARVWLAAGEPRIPAQDAELLHELAKVHALCGRRGDAIDVLRRMVKLGAPAGMLRDEDEFRGLRGSPEFQKLLSGG